ncbi:hemagglutinin repeat-containing protein [Pseudomonas sp. ML2-2023-3]
MNLKGKSIELLAAHDSTDSKTRDITTGGGIAWTASLDKVGSGLEFSRQDSKDNANRTKAKTSNVTATGNVQVQVQVQADNTLVNEGSRIVAGSGLQVNAARVDNRAAHNTESSSHTETGWQAGLGVSAEISGLSNPLEKVVKGLVNGTMPQSALTDGVELASVGLDGQVGYHNKTQAQQDSTALVSQLSGATLQVNVGGKLQDEGTQYRATDGALNIHAGSHDASAAVDTHSRSEQGVAAKVGVRAYTKTGEGVNVRVNGSGEFNRAQETASMAQVGRYAGANGVSIATQGDVRYEGGDFDGGAGSVNLNAGGKLPWSKPLTPAARAPWG